MNLKKLAWLVPAIALLMIGSLAVVQTAQAARLQVALVGSTDFPNANGKARFEDRGGEQRFRVEVEDASVPCAQLQVVVDGTPFGTMSGPLGGCRLALNSDLGQTVPAVVAGSQVLVNETIGGKLVVSGAF